MPKKWLPRFKVLQTHPQLWPAGHQSATSTALDLGWQGKTGPVLTWQLAWPMAVRVEGIMGKQAAPTDLGGLLGVLGSHRECTVAEVGEGGGGQRDPRRWGGTEWVDFQTHVLSTVY